MNDTNIEDLVAAANEARACSYSPYSGYAVGAAVRGANGKVYSGCNVENVSYGLALCAERSAVAAMVGDGCVRLQQVAVVTRDSGTPCGMCLQVLLEFANDPAAVTVCCSDESGHRTVYRLTDLLPHGFRSELKRT